MGVIVTYADPMGRGAKVEQTRPPERTFRHAEPRTIDLEVVRFACALRWRHRSPSTPGSLDVVEPASRQSGLNPKHFSRYNSTLHQTRQRKDEDPRNGSYRAR